jgi:low affinity Fe/Cu permease
MNESNSASEPAPVPSPTVVTNPTFSEHTVTSIVRKAFGWLLLGIVVAPLIGKLVMSHNADHIPSKEVFPYTKDSTGKPNRGVVGAWSQGAAPSSQADSAHVNPGEPIVVRTFDLDGWVLSLLSTGRLAPFLDKDAAPAMEKWAQSLLAPKPPAVPANPAASVPDSTAVVPPTAENPGKPLSPASVATPPPAATPPRVEPVFTDAILRDKFNRLFLEIRMGFNLIINDQIIPGLTALNASESRSLREEPGDRWDDFVFRLRPDDPVQRKIFQDLARGNGLTEKIRLSLCFDMAKGSVTRLIVPSVLEPGAALRSQQTKVSFAPGWKIWFMVFYGLALATGMALLGLQSNMLRALQSRRRPNGKHQLSLSHVQLAIWFIVVFGSYIYLWVITGDLNTLSTSGLYFVGIAIVTTMGSTAIQGMSTSDKEVAAYNNMLAPRLEMDRVTIVSLVDQAEASARKRWEELRQSGLSSEEQLNHDAFRNWDDLRRQKEYLATPLIYRWLVDLLSENGEVTLHRFQMLAWTLGLAFIFCVRVFADLTMPTFPGEVLGLMGISAGTYLGFRVPEAGRIKDSLASPESLGKLGN